jgi:hypothetical protein
MMSDAMGLPPGINGEHKSLQVVPFGKYKGRTVAELVADRGYSEWLIAQPGFQERNKTIYQIIVQGGPPCEDTPEHNRLQARFFDDDFCEAFTEACGFRLGVGFSLQEKKAEAARRWDRIRARREALWSAYREGAREIKEAEDHIRLMELEHGADQGKWPSEDAS